MASPVSRPLRVFAFDPTLGRRFGNHMTIHVPYEALRPGPRGEGIEVVDYDATRGCYYAPVDLDDREVLLRGGLPPSEADPRFHQQMVYAVARRTMDNFGTALGRPIRWTLRRTGGGNRRRALRIHPHAMQEANAYYDPDRHALLFGYFAASAAEAGPNLPGQTVFTCLSHDIIAHETTHALVHDVRHFFIEPTGPDTLAFHEAFADLVALFQHFSFKEALEDHILRTGGVLFRPELAPVVDPRRGGAAAGRAPDGRARTLAEEAQRNVLVGLAQQFGEAMGRRAALREALGAPPDPARLEKTFEPHERGAILVAAVFDAFFTVYSHRMADLLRIARVSTPGGSGELGLDLARRLAADAAKTASQFLNVCIRALDYCPPVDVTLGDFLRALLTADHDLVPDDDRGYRDILIDAFRRRGIRPGEVSSYSESALIWTRAERAGGRPLLCSGLDFDVIRGTSGEVQEQNARRLSAFAARHAGLLGLERGLPVQAWTFHPVHRVGPDGQLRFQVVAELLQRREVPLDPRRKSSPTLVYRGGTTLILDARTEEVLYAVCKRVGSRRRLERQRAFWSEAPLASPALFGAGRPRLRADFAVTHRGY